MSAGTVHSGGCAKYPDIAEKLASFVDSKERPPVKLRGGAYFGKRIVKAPIF
jgi:hypothetical protein